MRYARADFQAALDVSAYSLVALTRAAEPLMRPGSSVVTLSAIGSRRVIPGYNVMGVAKAALEASVRQLAVDLGPSGIRVNAVSAGAVRTVAAMGVPGFRALYRQGATLAPMRARPDQPRRGRAPSPGSHRAGAAPSPVRSSRWTAAGASWRSPGRRVR